MALKGMSPEMQAMDRAVKALNTKITKIAQTFGTDSRQYRQIEEILTGYDASGRQKNRFSILTVGATREKDGIIQVSRSRKALAELEISQYKKALTRIARLPSAAQHQKKIVEKWREEHTDPVTGKAPKLSKAEKAAIVSEAVSRDVSLNNRLEAALQALYEIQAETGEEFAVMSQIRGLSRGRWTELSDLEKMVELAEQAADDEDAMIQGDMYAGF